MKHILFTFIMLAQLSAYADERTIEELFSEIPDSIELSSQNSVKYDHLIIRGAFLIDGTGAPTTGPVDLEIEGNRITKITHTIRQSYCHSFWNRFYPISFW